MGKFNTSSGNIFPRYEDATFTEKTGHLGYFTRENPFPKQESEKTEVVFGYCDQFGYMSHMAYGQYTSGIETWENFSSEIEEHGYLYLDAGGNGMPFRVSASEIKRALKELGLINHGF